jgi:hypothetical protein
MLSKNHTQSLEFSPRQFHPNHAFSTKLVWKHSSHQNNQTTVSLRGAGSDSGHANTLKPVFHFKRTVPKRIKNVFKFQNFGNVDWLVLP